MNTEIRSRALEMEPSPLERAFENYQRMEAEVADTREKMQQLMISNSSLLAEVHMLRDALERSDGDRVRLQAISSTLLGRLLAINDAIAGAVKESIKHGIEAVQQAEVDKALEQAGEDAAAILQRVAPISPVQTPAAPKGAVGLPAVDLGLIKN